MALGSLGWFVALALRVGTPDGQELAGRTATFVYVPTGFIAALAVPEAFGRHRFVFAVALLIVLVMHLALFMLVLTLLGIRHYRRGDPEMTI